MMKNRLCIDCLFATISIFSVWPHDLLYKFLRAELFFVSCGCHVTCYMPHPPTHPHRKKAEALQMATLEGGNGKTPTLPLSNSMDKLLEGVDGQTPPQQPPKPVVIANTEYKESESVDTGTVI